MSIIKLNLDQYLTSKIFDPSPHRTHPDEVPVSERRIPIIYSCEKCNEKVSFKTDSFQLHLRSNHTNLKDFDREEFEKYMKMNNNENSFLDFYCPKCGQPTMIIFNGNPSGYWGEFELSIVDILIKK